MATVSKRTKKTPAPLRGPLAYGAQEILGRKGPVVRERKGPGIDWPAIETGDAPKEGAAVAVGRAITAMEDVAADLLRRANRIPGNMNPREQREALAGMFGDVRNAVDQARAAKDALGAHAAAQGKFGKALPKIRQAESSFNSALEKLEQYEQDQPKDNSLPELAALVGLMKGAVNDIHGDVEHLKQGLIETE